MSKIMILKLAALFFGLGTVFVVLGVILSFPLFINLGGAFVVILGGGLLIFGLTRKN